MPGAGGPPPGGAPPAPGPGGDGGPAAAMQALLSLQQAPPPDGEKDALMDVTTKLGFVLSRVQLRSAKAARLISEALSKIQGAKEALADEASHPIAPVPNLGVPSIMGAGAPGM